MLLHLLCDLAEANCPDLPDADSITSAWPEAADAALETVAGHCDAVVAELPDADVAALLVAEPGLLLYDPPGPDTIARVARWAIAAALCEWLLGGWYHGVGVEGPGYATWIEGEHGPPWWCSRPD